VDSYVKVENSDLSIGKTADLEARISGYNSDLKKRYKVLGYPTLIMLNSSGEVVGTYRGYKRGNAAFLWGQLKQAEAASLATYKTWRKGLENKGYREWKDRKDRKVFARLTSYSKGTLIFIEPDGTRSRTEETNLSDVDRAWVSDQKKLRRIE
jgi:hypothetical protein